MSLTLACTALINRFAEPVRQDKVLWSVGPRNNARNNPFALGGIKTA